MRKELVLVAAVSVLLFAFSANVDAGPASWWKFDEGEGLTADDTGTNNNDGTLYPTLSPPAWTTGISDDALQFDGTEDNVTCGGFSLDVSDLTVEAWINFTSESDNMGIVSRIYRDGSDFSGWGLYASYNGKVCGFFGAGGAGVAILSTNTYNDGLWHHVALRKGSSDIWDIYVDGIIDAVPETQSLSYGSSALLMGRRYANISGFYFDGTIDDVRVWDQALTGEQIMWHKNHPGLAIPEPSALLLLGSGLLGLLVFRRIGGVKKTKLRLFNNTSSKL